MDASAGCSIYVGDTVIQERCNYRACTIMGNMVIRKIRRWGDRCGGKEKKQMGTHLRLA